MQILHVYSHWICDIYLRYPMYRYPMFVGIMKKDPKHVKLKLKFREPLPSGSDERKIDLDVSLTHC